MNRARLNGATTVLLVPGIGSLRPGCLAPYADRPVVREVLAQVGEALGDGRVGELLTALPEHALPEHALPEHAASGRATPAPAASARAAAPDDTLIQLAGYAQAVAYCALAGPAADHTLLLGHSLGEPAAFAAAGVVSVGDGARLVLACLRWRATLEVPPGGLLVLRLSAAGTRLLLARVGLPGLALACDNAPEQSVVSGPRPAVEALAALARQDAVGCTLLPTRTLFHHPALAPVALRVRELAEAMEFRPPRLPVHGPRTGRAYRSAAEFRDGVTDHLLHPVPFRSCVARLWAAGVAGFAEAGPRPMLSRLTDSRKLKDLVSPES
ncbi:acyltransferase domain-containing protein [Kitasatospora sp. NBC_01287]|uniref:ACP S-malonyltransferase n=1 Tax=Kitasatospora sp. NBC_01287 TaxID=2903573 RepID=UPI002258CD26|nr:acyltransferase domain-containing protein [Kitasatospora sp. NBC_01287]MCX4744404.1 acyltransferase domain-containing protein [Kitasatospora sp. NBC_01287]